MAIGNREGRDAAGRGQASIARARRLLLPGSRDRRSPHNPALDVPLRAFDRPHDDTAGVAHARGFTLLEMLAVIALLAIAVTVTAVSLRGGGRGQLDAAAQRLAAGLRDTRTRAMATSRTQGFTIDLRDHSFAAPGRAPRHFPADAEVRVTSAAEDVSEADVARIRFFPDGSSSGGRVVLGARRHRATVAIDWLTGAVTVDADGESGNGRKE